MQFKIRISTTYKKTEFETCFKNNSHKPICGWIWFHKKHVPCLLISHKKLTGFFSKYVFCCLELLREEKYEIIQSKIGDDNKNNEQNSLVGSKLLTNDIVSLFNNDDNDDDDYDDGDVDDDNDEKKYSSPTSNLWAKKSPTQQIITQVY